MTGADELISLIKKGEKNKAEKLLQEICMKTFCQEHAVALKKILLTEAAKKLNSEVPGFYCDEAALSRSMFSQNPPSGEEVIGMFCQSLRDALREDNLRAFSKARAYIDGHLCDSQLSVGNAAEYAGISQSLMVKLFKENEAQTPGDYLGKKRVEKSLPLLDEGLSVSQAALLTGFCACETYIRTFKKHMGVTPGEWKRNK